MNRIMLGKWGEQVVSTVLQRAGWELVHRNLRTRLGELDLVMLHRPSGTLGVIEVKTSLVKRTLPLYRNIQKYHRVQAWRHLSSAITTPSFTQVRFFTAWVWVQPQVGVRIVQEDMLFN